jgi:hypothetical protein
VHLWQIPTINIPVIVRQGESKTSVTISDVSVKTIRSKPVCTFNLNRIGNMSVFGDVVINFTGKDGTNIVAGEAKNVAIYTPNTSRKFVVPLNMQGIDYHDGKLDIDYIEKADAIPNQLVSTKVWLH